VLSEADAERQIGAICFKTGPPVLLGAELEWLVTDAADPSLTVSFDRICGIFEVLRQPGRLPGAGLLTLEPGGQVELSTAPAASLAGCVAAASGDLAVLREAFGAAGLTLNGWGVDPVRESRRVLQMPRYAAMERYFDRGGPWGRVMMCSTASVQVCVDAGVDDSGPVGYPFRWRLLHALGPVLVAAFANSPVRCGRPTGWKCTRQLVWSHLDSGRTRPPPGAEPHAAAPAGDPRSAWVSYAMDAGVMCLRQPEGPWPVPADLTFRDWLRRGDGRPGDQCGGRGPTADDLGYHLSTLFPPVRPRGHLELRMIDAQPDDGWIVPVALVAALTSDPDAAQSAMAAAEAAWTDDGAGQPGNRSPWLRAAKDGAADVSLGRAAAQCFEIAAAALAATDAPQHIRDAVSGFADRYASRGRCPADDVLDAIDSGKGRS